jgi:type IV secretion system protein VirD4
MTLDEVRMLDNSDALLFIRGERPVKDKKYNILKHPNIKRTEDGGAAPYVHKPKAADYALPDLPYAVNSLDDIDFIELEESQNEQENK